MLITGDKKKDKKLWRDINWSREHSQELHDSYERTWVAIYDQQVVVSDKNPRIVEKIALEKTGVSRKELYIIYVEDSKALYRQT
ncbi:hypothetical protein FJZ31_25105 [Candidatus Poribacteria bacterium]|nr:hypothetical protein [Candidatus Poribacteria bacterium]